MIGTIKKILQDLQCRAFQISIMRLKAKRLVLDPIKNRVHSICRAYLCSRAVGRSEKPGVPVLFGGHKLPPSVEIGLTDLPKFGGAMAPPAHPWGALSSEEGTKFDLQTVSTDKKSVQDSFLYSPWCAEFLLVDFLDLKKPDVAQTNFYHSYLKQNWKPLFQKIVFYF